MTEEIFFKLDYEIKEKEKQKELEKKAYLEMIEKNTQKMYLKIWSKILKKYKSGRSNISLKYVMKAYKNEQYGFSVCCLNLSDFVQMNNKLINIKELQNLLNEDGIKNTVYSKNEGNEMLLFVDATDELLRTIKNDSEKKYSKDKVLTKSKGKK